MSRTTANHVTVIRCDSPICPTVGGARFMTASIAAMARVQARDARWQRLPAWTITDEDSPRRKYDICPVEAPAALERKARRPEILAEQRHARKLQRGWEMQAVALRRVERQIARRAREIAKAAREVAKIEKRDCRARRDAEQISRRVDAPAFATPAHVDAVRIIREAEPLTCAAASVLVIEDAWRTATHDETGEGEFADDGTWRDAKDPAVLEEADRVVDHITTSPPLPASPKPRTTRTTRTFRTGPSILDVIERILRARGDALTVADIVGYAIGDLVLPTASKTPKTIVARDLALDIRDGGSGSRFVRTAPGIFMLRDQWEKSLPRKESP